MGEVFAKNKIFIRNFSQCYKFPRFPQLVLNEKKNPLTHKYFKTLPKE